MACSSSSSSSPVLSFRPRIHPKPPKPSTTHLSPQSQNLKKLHFRLSYRFPRQEESESEEEQEEEAETFDEAVFLFNARSFYKCHDYLESLWNKAEEPKRTLIRGILQCAVGFHHLFGQNHRGAMMELGEGLCKIKKMNFESGPFWKFEKEVSNALEFVYQTQLELAACTDDLCVTMDGSELSYQLLGSFAAGQQLYHLENNSDGISFIVYCPDYGSGKPTRVKVPTLHATKEHLMACEY